LQRAHHLGQRLQQQVTAFLCLLLHASSHSQQPDIPLLVDEQ
jgi:hypothetical protein